MKVERLIVGWFTAPLGIFRAGDDVERAVRFPIPAYLLETGSERILVDTGLNPAAIADPAGYYDRPDIFGVCRLEQDRSVADQVDLETVTRVVLTHLHWDHVGGLELVPRSTPVVVQRQEWEAGRDEEAVRRNNFLRRDYEGEREIVLVDGDHDLLGDGSVELLYTPGHTPGHQSIRVGPDLVLGSTCPISPPASTTIGSRSSPTTTSSRGARRSGCGRCAKRASPWSRATSPS